jgi:hypothetical protein
MGYCPSFVSHDATTLIFGFVLFYHDRRKLRRRSEELSSCFGGKPLPATSHHHPILTTAGRPATQLLLQLGEKEKSPIDQLSAQQLQLLTSY